MTLTISYSQSGGRLGTTKAAGEVRDKENSARSNRFSCSEVGEEGRSGASEAFPVRAMQQAVSRVKQQVKRNTGEEQERKSRGKAD